MTARPSRNDLRGTGAACFRRPTGAPTAPVRWRRARSIAERPETLADFRGRLVAELAGREEGYTADGKLVPGRPAKPVLSHLLEPQPS